jgi:hypothetical protein
VPGIPLLGEDGKRARDELAGIADRVGRNPRTRLLRLA